jgi:seryl-tRNA synthetase
MRGSEETPDVEKAESPAVGAADPAPAGLVPGAVTPADHANTVREALKAARYDHAPAYHVAMAALDALEAQAETADRETSHLRMKYKRRTEELNTAENTAADMERAWLASRDEVRQLRKRAEAAEAERDAAVRQLAHAQDALREIAESGVPGRKFRSPLAFVIHLQGIARRAALAADGKETA